MTKPARKRGRKRTRGPTTASEFNSVLAALDDAGYSFGSDLGLVPKDSASSEEALTDLMARYPGFGREVQALLDHVVFDADLDQKVLGTAEGLAAKVDAAREKIFTSSWLEEYLVGNASKVPTFNLLDWEVVIKTSEYAVPGATGFAYALLSLHTLERPSEARDQRSFSIGARGLDLLIETLQGVRQHLEVATAVGGRLSEVHEQLRLAPPYLEETDEQG